MSRSRWTYITCDRCALRREQEAASVDLMATEAERDGWSIREDRDDGRDLCADCADHEGDA